MRIAIIGGGFAGVATALELADRGTEIHIFERAERALSGASRHNEGKIHLGYIYAQDRSLRTADLMARGAAVFQDALYRWLGEDAGRLPVSPGFLYAVHRDSLVSPADCEAHLNACNGILQKYAPGLDGPFASPVRAPQRLTEAEREQTFASDAVLAAFRTDEVSIDPGALCDALEQRVLATSQIALHTECEIAEVAQRGNRLALLTSSGDRLEFDHVVNAAWEGRLPLDQQMGLPAPPRWSHRMKYYLRLEGDCDLPTVSFVLGPFGDIARYGGSTYLSWYPAGMRHWSFDPAPPAWPTHLDGREAEDLSHAIRAGLAGVVPAVAGVDVTGEHATVRGGVICAIGRRDVDDPDSALHDRTAGVGIQSRGNYHSFSSGKLTTIPYFAAELAGRIRAGNRRYA
ncbi:MAG: FAD-dependent oxidoreductase [Pseudomonadota bacterium]